MADGMRVLGLGRALLPRKAAGCLLSLGLCSTASCALPAQGDIPPLASSPPAQGFGGSTSVGGPPSFGGDGGSSCTPSTTSSPVFANQVFNNQTVFAREFYAWTTDEQVRALRQDQRLFAQPAAPGPPFTFLGSNVDPLARVLQNAFNMGRYAWPEPWATRMGWPDRDRGGQLVRIVLKPEAWLAFVADGLLWVFDAQQHYVSTGDALANQALIGAIYFDSTNHDQCTSEPSGYRAFLLGNLAMVQEWSVGTQLIHDRVLANIGQLTRFLTGIRSCPVTTDASTWAQNTRCSWQNERVSLGGTDTDTAGNFGGAGATEESAYDQALAIPSPNYLPAPMQIATMIETLQGDLFEPDPLVVTPGSP